MPTIEEVMETNRILIESGQELAQTNWKLIEVNNKLMATNTSLIATNNKLLAQDNGSALYVRAVNEFAKWALESGELWPQETKPENSITKIIERFFSERVKITGKI